MKIALATLPFEGSIDGAIMQVGDALRTAEEHGASILCTPEAYLPGLRGIGRAVEAVDSGRLGHALETIGRMVADRSVALVLGMERPAADGLLISTAVYDRNGRLVGCQDKVQLDPSESGFYAPGQGRSIFEVDELTFGVAICHEGWRYPETVRWAARRGAQLVFLPHYGMPTDWGAAPTLWAESRNSFHEKAAMCRAAENTVYVAAVNYALPASQTTSAVINPDGTLLAHQPYGEAGVLVANLDLTAATGGLALRYRPEPDAIAKPE